MVVKNHEVNWEGNREDWLPVSNAAEKSPRVKWPLVSRSLNRVMSSGRGGIAGSRTHGVAGKWWDTGGRAIKGNENAFYSDMY